MNLRAYGWSLLGFLGLEGVSLLVYRHPVASLFVLGAAFITAAAVGLTRPRVGLLLLTAELVVGSKGYLIFGTILGFRASLRLALFVGFAAGYVIRCIRTRRVPWRHLVPYRWPLIVFAASFLLASVLGLLHRPGMAVFLDANAFLFLALIVPFGELSRRDLPRVLAVVLAGTTVVALESYVLLAWFAHGPAETLAFVYHWVRDTGVGEISPILGSVFRVFLQSQVYSLLGSLLVLGLLAPDLTRGIRRSIPGALAVAVLAGGVAVSLSRSFWVGAVVGAVALPLAFPPLRHLRSLLRYGGVLLGAVALNAFLTSWALNLPLPLPLHGASGGALVAARVTNLAGDAAASSRLEQAPVLVHAIVRSPLWGYGFAKELTYTSNDPRVRQANPSGRFTTDAFELGYLDQLLKLGLFGTVALLALWGVLLRRLWQRRREPLAAGAFAATLALLAVHIFSPYLNHPLGIGWFLLADSFTRDAV